MDRVTEPELMVDDDQALAYSDANFADSHQAAVTRFGEAFPDFATGRILDLACGPADITVRFARAYPEATIIGLEGSAAMLALGVQRVRREGYDAQVSFEHRVLPDPDLADLGAFDAVVCTNSLHHFHDPAVLWHSIGVAAAPGALRVRPGPHAPRLAGRGPSARRRVRAGRARRAPAGLLQLAVRGVHSGRDRGPARGGRAGRLRGRTRHGPPPGSHRSGGLRSSRG